MEKSNRKTKSPKKSEATFESLVARLDEIVALLESGERPLEDSICLFEEGMRLCSQGMHKLDDAERKIQVLLVDSEGERVEPFREESGDAP
jgi:exodeoxyribonuclease VII small subunit